MLLKPVCCPPSITFNTLPELYFWIDWIAGRPGYAFGANRVPTGSFDEPRAMADAGWVNMDYHMDGITAQMATVPREAKSANRMIRMTVQPEKKEDLDKNVPFFDFPVAAIRSPAIEVQAKNLIRISVLVKRPIASTPGMGGIVVRDSIGGEQFQFRTSDAIPAFSRVVLYRKAPSDGKFTVTLGLAGYGEAFFDDFRVELVEAESEATAPRPDRRRSTPPGRRVGQPLPPDPSLPAAATNPSEQVDHGGERPSRSRKAEEPRRRNRSSCTVGLAEPEHSPDFAGFPPVASLTRTIAR